jgi:molybdate transport system ATP-binding protein
MLSDSDLQAIQLTVQLAGIVTAILLLIGTPIAWWLARTPSKWKGPVGAVVALPLVLPPSVLGFYLLLAMGPNGPIGQLTRALEIGPLPFTFWGLVLASVLYSMPFMVQPLQNAFEAVGERPLEVAATLRASPLDAFFSVALPLALPGYLTAAILTFAHTVGEFGVVLMIGGNLPGVTRVASVQIYDHVEALEYAQAHRLAAVMLAFSFLVLLARFMPGGPTRKRLESMDNIQARFRLAWPGFSLDVDLALPNRGVTALFGHSGSGKTTLLRCIAGLERARQGFLSFRGEVWQDGKTWLPTHKRPLGYVFQEASLFPHLTVLGNLRYGWKRIAAERQANLDQAVELLGIGPLLDRKPERLSGGERQRVAIARALAVDPQLLLMDEPLTALDIKRKQEILPYLERLRDELDIPVLYVSHSPDEVARLADYLVAMENGRVSAHGPLGDTLARLDLPIHLGEEAGVVLDAVIAERDAAWHLVRVDFPGGSLWTRDQGLAAGRRVRVRILARDVSLALQRQEHTSILNLLPGRVDAMADDEHAGLALVRVRIGPSALVARLTKRSAAILDLTPGKEIWVQVKSVALIE